MPNKTDEPITTNQLIEEAKNAGKNIYLLQPLPEINTSNAELLGQRLDEMSVLGKSAWDKKAYLEYLTLLLLYLEVFLRLYLVGKKMYSGLDMTNDRKTFGQIIGLCEKHGFDTHLLHNLRLLNKRRNTYIHGFVLYNGRYEDLEADKPMMSKLPVDVAEYVITTVGTITVNPDDLGKPGQICIIK